jgi:Flp pilus assembly protein TadD
MAEYRRRQSVHVADAVAWALHANARDAEALRYARKALALGYRNASFHFHAGMIAAGLLRDGLARRWLSEALEINPHFSVRWSPVARRTLARLGAGA